MESEVSMFRCWEGSPGASNGWLSSTRVESKMVFPASGDVRAWRESRRGVGCLEWQNRSAQLERLRNLEHRNVWDGL